MDNNINIDELMQVVARLTEGLTNMAEVAQKTTEQEEKDLQKSVERTAGYTRDVHGKLVSNEEKRIEIEDRLNKELESQFSASKLRANKQESAYRDQLKQLNYVIDNNGKLVKTTVELDNAQNKLLQDLKKQAQFEDQLKQLNYMMDANGKLVKTTIKLDDAQQKQIANAKKLSEDEAKRIKSKDNVIPELKKGLMEIGKASWGVASNLAKGETSFTTLFPLMDSLADATAAVGKSLFGMIPFIGDFVGTLFSATTKALLEGSKFLIQMLEKSVKDFQEMGNAGALIGGGMTALNDQILKAGMTTDGFKKVVKESAGTLATWQGTVGEGARKFSKAVGDLSLTKTGDDLRRLGLTADDMGESAAAFLTQEIRMGRNRQMTEKQLTEGTIQYVKELDLLQKVTGLSRQDAQKQREELMSDSKYRASIQGMNEENQNALNGLIMRFKDPNLKRGLMDLASGAIGTKDAGMVTMALGDSAANAIQSIKDAKPDELPKVLDKVMLDFRDSAKNNQEMFGEVYKYLEPGTMINAATIFDIAAGKYTTSMEKAKEAQDAQIKNTDELTNNTINAQKNMELLSRNMRELANDQLPKASKAVEYFTKKLYEAVSGIFDGPEGDGTKIATEKEADKNIENAEKKLETARKNKDKEAEKKAQQELDAARHAKELAEIARRNRKQPGSGEPVKPNTPSEPTPTPVPTPVTTPEENAKKLEEIAKRNRQKPGAGEPVKPNKPAATTPTPVPSTPPKPASSTPPKPASGPSTTPTPSPAPEPSTNPNKKTIDQLLKFGSRSGDKAHFDMLNSDVRDAFMKMIEEYGKPVQITSAFRSYEEQKELWDAASSTSNPNMRMQKNGIPVTKPGSSSHEQKKAIDLSKSDALEFYNTTKRNGSDLLNKYGFNYDPIKDAVHFEKARFGGAFDGPEAGYPVMLHGKETVIPTPKLDAIKNTAESVTKTSLGTQLSSITPASNNINNNESVAILESLHDIMTSKFDQMITQMERSTDIQSRLLNNSLV
jgi:LAS superfamily LD-carboxypeptidase LdcB